MGLPTDSDALDEFFGLRIVGKVKALILGAITAEFKSSKRSRSVASLLLPISK